MEPEADVGSSSEIRRGGGESRTRRASKSAEGGEPRHSDGEGRGRAVVAQGLSHAGGCSCERAVLRRKRRRRSGW
jgi:hypothetical protein